MFAEGFVNMQACSFDVQEVRDQLSWVSSGSFLWSILTSYHFSDKLIMSDKLIISDMLNNY